MLFNSYTFIFIYLPVVFAGMFWIGRHSHRLAALWLAIASLAFYAAWDARFVLLLLGSISFNYGASYWIGLKRHAGASGQAKHSLAIAIAANLALLGYFKYANFFMTSVNHLSGGSLAPLDIILPLGISFFTFTQIAFLVDVYRGVAREYNFIHYLLFVTYFPHLIAGPVLHHKQIMPQFAKPETYRVNWENVAVGLTIFIFGLAKKVLIADTLAEYATPVFDVVKAGSQPMLFEAWIGALSYTLQLYFDFSGYSDMAIGLSLIFNVRMPVNFDSPYKATSVIEFWRRWHMTLAAFLRDYLYIPLGGNRKGAARRHINLMATMLLGGLWHGAGWTFVAWGGLHGLYLMVNHAWRGFKQRMGWSDDGRWAKLGSAALTFFAVVVGWVFFRADSLASAMTMLHGMAGVNGVSLSTFFDGRLPGFLTSIAGSHLVFNGLAPLSRVSGGMALFNIMIGLAMVWLFPNVRQMMANYQPTWEDMERKRTPAPLPRGWLALKVDWRPTPGYALAVGAIFTLCVFGLTKVSEFIYFQF
jgi:D-alanyl-lipoteichoic acid acyltransferase DltB (MBOAT superfamily)